MINPQDSFGKVMLENLEDRGCRLQGIQKYPNEESQVKRMIEFGAMSSAECFNMQTIYNSKLDKTEKARIEKLEIFDEYEEWEMLSIHYCVSLGKRISAEEKSTAIQIAYSE
jgi:tRNA wybutosine-synthesizing protein 4